MHARAPLTVACVDDNPAIGEALQQRVALEPSLQWKGVIYAPTAAEIEQQLRALAPDVVLLDIDMPGIDPFTMLERMSRSAPAIRMVVFSGHLNRGYVERALDCGAWGYLSKNDDVQAVLQGVHSVGRGEIALSMEAETVLSAQRA